MLFQELSFYKRKKRNEKYELSLTGRWLSSFRVTLKFELICQSSNALHLELKINFVFFPLFCTKRKKIFGFSAENSKQIIIIYFNYCDINLSAPNERWFCNFSWKEKTKKPSSSRPKFDYCFHSFDGFFSFFFVGNFNCRNDNERWREA